MNKLLFTLCLLLAACNPYWKDAPDRPITSTPANDPSPISAPFPQIGWQTYQVVGTVNIRANADVSSSVIGILYSGAVVSADCTRDDGFCEVIGGYVIEACLGIGEGICK